MFDFLVLMPVLMSRWFLVRTKSSMFVLLLLRAHVYAYVAAVLASVMLMRMR